MGKREGLLRILAILAYILVVSVVLLLLGMKIGRPLVLVEVQNVHHILSLLGVPNVPMGTMIYIPGINLSFRITWQCSGMFSMSVYTIVYLTFPGIRKDVFRWLLGVSVLYIVNLMRIAVAIYLYVVSGERAFSLFHYTVGPILMFVVMVLLLGDVMSRRLKEVGQSI